MIPRKTLLAGAGLAAGAFLAFAPTALAGDPNAGDVWVDGATTQTTGVDAAGPGHENDPHLDCGDVGLFAAKMADPSSAEQNTFTLYAWPPTGHQQSIYTSNWTYAKGAADPQEIAVIPASVFGSGGHFKVQVTQDPRKQKVFWVDCPGGVSGQTSSPSPSPSASSSTGPSPSPAGAVSGSSGGSGAVSGSTAGGSAASGSAPRGGVLGAVAGASGAVLAVTGFPLTMPIAGAILLAIGAAVSWVRRRVLHRG